MHKIIVFDQNRNLIGDIKSILLADILDPVDKLACYSFISQIVRYCYIQSNCELTIIGNLPAGNILRDYLNIFQCQNYLLSADCYGMIAVVFKRYNLLWCKQRDCVADLFHQLTISRTKGLEIWLYLFDKN